MPRQMGLGAETSWHAETLGAPKLWHAETTWHAETLGAETKLLNLATLLNGDVTRTTSKYR